MDLLTVTDAATGALLLEGIDSCNTQNTKMPGLRVPLYTCRGRAVGLLHDWQGGYAKTVSGYGKRV